MHGAVWKSCPKLSFYFYCYLLIYLFFVLYSPLRDQRDRCQGEVTHGRLPWILPFICFCLHCSPLAPTLHWMLLIDNLNIQDFCYLLITFFFCFSFSFVSHIILIEQCYYKLRGIKHWSLLGVTVWIKPFIFDFAANTNWSLQNQIKVVIIRSNTKPQTNYHYCLRFSFLTHDWLNFITWNTITCHKYF